jgi:hypothetical protein
LRAGSCCRPVFIGDVNKKYSEQIFRHAAVTGDGKPCEILERVTFEHLVGEGGVVGAPTEVNRRYDLRTGERLNRLSDTSFEDDVSGEQIQLRA